MEQIESFRNGVEQRKSFKKGVKQRENFRKGVEQIDRALERLWVRESFKKGG